MRTQTGLIGKVLKTANMTDCNAAPTPASNVPLGLDSDGELFKESWNCATVMGMLMHLSSNAHPDIAYTVN